MIRFFFKNPLATLFTLSLGLICYAVIAYLIGVCSYVLVFSETAIPFEKVMAIVCLMLIVAVDMLLEQVLTWRHAVRVLVADIATLAIPVYIVISWLLLANYNK